MDAVTARKLAEKIIDRPLSEGELMLVLVEESRRI